MKVFGVLLLLAVAGCADNRQEQKKIAELKEIISAIDREDFSMFDKYFSKDQLFPIFHLQDTVFTNINHTNIYTDIITYTNNNTPLMCSNQYGVIFYENSKPLVSLQEISNISEQLQLPEYKFLGADDLAYMYTDIYTLNSDDHIDSKLRNSIVGFDHLTVDTFDLILGFVSYKEDPEEGNPSKNTRQLADLSDQLNYKLRVAMDRPFDQSFLAQYLLRKVAGDTFEEQKNALANAYIKALYPRNIQNTNGILEVIMQPPVSYR